MLAAAAMMAAAACADEAGVKVSSFGWDPEDSTRFIQAALDSDAPTIILDRQAGPWMTLPLWARSNKKIVFEPGVELQAKKGAFRGIRDYLFSVQGVSNVTLIGSGGARMKMHKADYQHPPYERSEWRYALRIVGSTNVYVQGLAFVESGGDGILVAGNAKDVTLRDCVCDGNHRQGISVIGAENLLIEDCVMRNTSGTPPQAGIDFEPDHASEPLINCVMRNCLVENNRGAGYEFYLGQLTAATKPLSVLIENCRSVGNSTAAGVNFGYTKPTHPKGSITFRNCTFDSPRRGGISIANKPAGAAAVTFEGCTVAMAPSNSTVAVELHGDSRWDMGPVDDVTLKDLTVKLAKDGNTNWVKCTRSLLHPASVKNVIGNVRIIRPDGSETVETLDEAWCAAHLPPATDRPLLPRVLPELKEWKDAIVNDTCPGKMVDLPKVWIPRTGHGTHYVFYAAKKGDVTFAGRSRKVVKNASEKGLKGTMRVFTVPGGGKVFTCDIPGSETAEFTVKVPRAGFYELNPKLGGYDFLLERASVPIAIDTRAKSATLVAAQSPLKFWLAAKAETPFTLLASGGTYSGSMVNATLFNAEGAEVAKGIGTREWTLLDGKAAVDGLWRLDVTRIPKKPYSFFCLDVAGLPGLFFLSSEKTWRFK